MRNPPILPEDAHRYRHLSAYAFFPIEDTQAMKDLLLEGLGERDIWGTILCSNEGLNIGLLIQTHQEEDLRDFFENQVGTPKMEFKLTQIKTNPYGRLRVKVKKEIVTTGYPEVNPAEFTGDYIKPRELKRWLDEGRDFLFLDTRNDYEVRMGKFEKAKELKVPSFRSFLDHVESLPAEVKEKKEVVTYCTGGIRCEKATAIMIKKMGFKKVYQLEGGILKYFEECGGDHYDGECFVFDKRIGINAKGDETPSQMCHACRTPLSARDYVSPYYKQGESCPYCWSRTKRAQHLPPPDLELPSEDELV